MYVFIRITFTFPRDYPQASHPGGVPQVELERNPLISMKNRLYILRRLHKIREHWRPCLEPCLRFLLFGDGDDDNGSRARSLDSASSSEDELLEGARRPKEGAHPPSRQDKNLAEPRTSQGVFGPNGRWILPDHMPQSNISDVPKGSLFVSSERPHVLCAILGETSPHPHHLVRQLTPRRDFSGLLYIYPMPRAVWPLPQTIEKLTP